MKKVYMMYIRKRPRKLTINGWEYETMKDKVRVMARAEGYSMVRFPRSMPMVVSDDELFEIESEAGK